MGIWRLKENLRREKNRGKSKVIYKTKPVELWRCSSNKVQSFDDKVRNENERFFQATAMNLSLILHAIIHIMSKPIFIRFLTHNNICEIHII